LIVPKIALIGFDGSTCRRSSTDGSSSSSNTIRTNHADGAASTAPVSGAAIVGSSGQIWKVRKSGVPTRPGRLLTKLLSVVQNVAVSSNPESTPRPGSAEIVRSDMTVTVVTSGGPLFLRSVGRSGSAHAGSNAPATMAAAIVDR